MSGWAPVLFGHTAADVMDVDLPGGQVTLGLPGGHVGTPVHAGGDVVYRGVEPSTDLRYTPTPASVKEKLVLRSAAAPHSFTFHLADPGGLLGTPTETAGEGWTFSGTSASGAQVTLPAPRAWSEADEQGSGGKSGPSGFGTSAHQSVVRAGNGWDVTLSLDSAWAAGKSFPIVLDPTVVDYTHGAGLTELTGGSDCGKLGDEFGEPGIGGNCRSYFNAAVTDLAGVSVTSASLSFGELGQTEDAEFPVEAHAATAVLSAGQSGGLLVSDEAPAVLASVPAGEANTRYSMNLTSVVRSWVEGKTPADGLILQVPDAGGNSNNFLTNVELTLTYSGTPSQTGTLDWTLGTPDDGTTFDSKVSDPESRNTVTVGASVFGAPPGVTPSTVSLTATWAPHAAGTCDTSNASGLATPTLTCTASNGVTASLSVTARTDDGTQTVALEYDFAPGGAGGGGSGPPAGETLGWDDATPKDGTVFTPGSAGFVLELDASTNDFGQDVTISYGKLPNTVSCPTPASTTGTEALIACSVAGDGATTGSFTFTATTSDGSLTITRTYSLAVAPSLTTNGVGGGNPTGNQTNCPGDKTDPVNCSSGDFYEAVTDLAVPGRGVALNQTRTYNAMLATVNGPLGYGWQFGYGMHLSFDATSAVATVSQGNGTVAMFAANGDGTYTAPPQVFATLTANPDGTYTMEDTRALTRYDFDASGRLLHQIDRNGYVTALTYTGSLLTSVADPAGRTLTFSYDSTGRLTGLLDPAGRTVAYRYDSAGNLAGVTDVAGGNWSYGYDSAHRLVTMTNPRGGVTTNVYDTANRVTSQADPAGRTTTLAYTGDPSTDAGSTTTITDPLGNVTVNTFTHYEMLTSTRGFGTAQQATWTYAYDPATDGVTSVTDPLGAVTSYTYDAQGNTMSMTDPLGRTSSATYNGLDEPTQITDPAGTVTTLSYDSAGNLTGDSAPLTATGQGVTTQMLYGDPAHPGDLTSVVDADGHSWVFRYNGNGDKTAQVDPSGDTTTMSYDSIGRATTTVSPKGNLTGASPAAFTTTMTYNPRGQLLSTRDPLGHTSTMTYDGVGNLLTSTDGLGNRTTSAFDADNEPTQVTKADGSLTSFGYDADGNQTSQTDGNHHTTRYAYGPLNQLTAVTDPLGRVTRYGYDLVGNHTTSTDPRGITSTFSFDPARQPTAITYSDATPAVAFTYTVDGQRASMDDGTGITSYTYDSLNRLTGQTDGAGQRVGYGYDLAGQLTALTYPNGQTVSRAYDVDGQLSAVTDWLGHTTTIAHDADGNTTQDGYGNGVLANNVFNNADQLTGLSDIGSTGTSLASFGYTRDNNGQLTSTSSTGAGAAPSESYAYTALNQLRSVNTAAYAYDPAGNLTSKAGSALTYDAGDQLTAMNGPSGSTGYGYDPAGDRTSSVGGADTSTAACGICVLAPTAAGAVTVSGTAAVSSTGVVAVASSSTSAIAGSGSATVHGSSVYTGGSVKLTGTAAVSPTAVSGTTADPLATALPPTMTGTKNALNVTGSTHATAQPGVYTSISVSGAGTLALAPGDYVLAGGNLTGSGSAVITGSHVTIFLTCASYPTPCPTGATGAGLSLSGNSQLTLAGAADTSGISVFADRHNTAPASVTGSATATITGHLYAPATPITVSGNTVLTVIGTLAVNQLAVAGSSKVADTAPAHVLPSASYSYDAAHRLTQATTGAGTSTYSYDGGGLRATTATSGATSHFAWALGAGIPLMLTDGATSYLYDDTGTPIEHIDAAGNTAYYQHDQYASTRLLTNQTGTVAATYTYDAYGTLTNRTGSTSTPLLWNGQQQDSSTGQYYLRDRYYDPTTAGFLTRDPLAQMTMSAYGYAYDNPINLEDPTGLNTVGICPGAAGLLGPISLSASDCLTRTVGSSPDQIGIVSTGSVGGGAGASISIGLSYQISNANSLQDLAGPFTYFTVSGEFLFGLTATVFWNDATGAAAVYGIELGLDTGAGGGFAGGTNDTFVKRLNGITGWLADGAWDLANPGLAVEGQLAKALGLIRAHEGC